MASHVRSSVLDVFARLRDRLATPALAAASHAPLLEPSTTLLPGDLAVVGSLRQADAEQLLSTIALDGACERQVLIVTLDRTWAMTDMLSILTGLPPDEAIRPTTPENRQCSQLAREHLATMQIEILERRHDDAIEAIECWLQAHAGGLVVFTSAWWVSSCGDEWEAARFVRWLKEVARSTQGTIVVPWRVNETHRMDRRSQLRDLALTGAAEDDADQVVLFFATDYGPEVYLAKNRHGAPGYIFDGRDLLTFH